MYSTALLRLQQVAGQLNPANYTTPLIDFTRRHGPETILTVKTYIMQHPQQVILGSILAFPSLILTPALYLVGFGPLGPIANSIAAWYQATAGNPVARGVFAHAQSAGMAGYGLGVLNGVVRGTAVLVWIRGR